MYEAFFCVILYIFVYLHLHHSIHYVKCNFFILVSETEKRRLQDAFRRSSATNSNLSKQVNKMFNFKSWKSDELVVFSRLVI